MSESNPKSGSPFRSGYADYVFGRPCVSPWAEDGFPAIRKNAEYLKGYTVAQENGVQFLLKGKGHVSSNNF